MSHYFNTHNFSKNNHFQNSIHYRGQVGKYLIEIATGNYIKFDQALTNFPHSHNCYEICTVISGHGAFNHGNDRYQLKEGMLFLADRNIIHEISSFDTKDLYIHFFTFNFVLTNKTIHRKKEKEEEKIIDRFLEGHSIIADDIYDLYHYFPLLNRSVSHQDDLNYLNSLLLKSLILEFISKLTKPYLTTYINKTIHNKVVLEAERYIDQHLNQKITVKEVADYCHVSERNLRRLIKKHYGITVIEHIRQKKMNKAQAILNMGFTIDKTSEECGFSDIAYFNRVFKSYYGLSPRDFKNRHIHK